MAKKFLSCDLCCYKTAIKGNLSYHMNWNHKIEESICKVCKKVFKNKARLQLHTKKIHLEKRDQHECLLCYNKKFRVYTQLKKHMESWHNNLIDKMKSTFTCDICGFDYYSKKHLDSHMGSQHAPPFKCFDLNCKMSFSSGNYRKKHFLSFHHCHLEVGSHNIWFLMFN